MATLRDIVDMKRWYRNYTRSFASDPAVAPALRLKQDHGIRVACEMRKLASALKLDEAEARIAIVTGLLHDIGRFEQYTRYGTFVDARSVNHGELGVQVLTAARVLGRFGAPVRTRIFDAVRLHNRAAVPDGLRGEGLRLVRMLRDADKLDIWNIVVAYYEASDQTRFDALDLDLPHAERISPAVAQAAWNGQLCRIGELRSTCDFKVLQMTWIYDINFTATFREIARRRFLERIRDALPRTALVEALYQRTRRHLDEALEAWNTSKSG